MKGKEKQLSLGKIIAICCIIFAGIVFASEAQAGETTRVSVGGPEMQGNNGSYYPSISTDGRYVVFHSNANNLVPGDTNGQMDVFVHNRETGETTLVSVNSAGNQGNDTSSVPSISSDGRYVAFRSSATNLVPGGANGWQIYVRDLATGETTLVSMDSAGNQGNGDSYVSG